MMLHHCHLLGCKAECPPRHLICTRHWSMVPKNIQDEVYRTVGLRKKNQVDKSWAPWWLAQYEAIDYILRLENRIELANKNKERELKFIKYLKSK